MQDPVNGVERHTEDSDDEAVRRNGKEGARLSHSSQVHQRDHDNGAHCPGNSVVSDGVKGGGYVVNSRGDGYGYRQRVIHQQCAGDKHTCPGAQVGGDHLVIAAATWIGVHVLPI